MSVAFPPASAASARRFLLFRLRLLQLRLWSERLVQDAVRGLCFGLAIALGGALALVAQSGVVDRENLALVALVGLAAGVLWALVRPPSLLRTARVADARFSMEARLGTAVELLRRSDRGRFADEQLGQTVAALRTARGGWPLPGAQAWREALLALSLALTLLVTLRFEGQGPTLLERLPAAQPESAPEPGERQMLPAAVAAPSAASAAPRASTTNDPKTGAAVRTLDELRRAREAGTLSPEQAQGALDQVESQLGERSAEASRQRETLDRLARALSQVSASEAAAESIQRGEYGQAGQQLNQLGQEADQLSPDAKAQLSQALRRSAAESSANPALAEQERRAADALAGRDYQATQSALANLGNEVARAEGQAAKQAELGDAMQQLQQERTANAAASSATGAERTRAGEKQPGSSGQSGGSQAGDGEGSGRGGGGGDGEAIAPGQNARQPAQQGPAEKAAPDAIGDAAARLDSAGQQVEVPARPGNSAEAGNPTTHASDDEQVRDGAQAAFESDRPVTSVQAGGQSERIVVPGDQRQVVRDYFGKRSGRGAP